MTEETYNGYANRETWAFNLHWSNDQGLYNETLSHAASFLAEHAEDEDDHNSDYQIGEAVVDYWTERMDEYDNTSEPVVMDSTLRRFKDEVGSFWRVDRAEVGASVRESLVAEDMSPEAANQ